MSLTGGIKIPGETAPAERGEMGEGEDEGEDHSLESSQENQSDQPAPPHSHWLESPLSRDSLVRGTLCSADKNVQMTARLSGSSLPSEELTYL